MTELNRAVAVGAAIAAWVVFIVPIRAQAPKPTDPLAGPPVTLGECLDAVQHSPAIRLAQLALDAASAALVQTRAKQGLVAGETAGYSHVGTSQSGQVSLSSASAASGSGGVVGENIKGGVSLTSPDSSLGVSALQSLPPNPTDKVTSFGLTGSQVLWDGYAGGISSALVKMAESTYKIAEITRESAVKAAILQTQQAYYTLLGDQKTLLVRQATVQLAESNLLLEQSMLDAQRATTLDLGLAVRFSSDAEEM